MTIAEYQKNREQFLKNEKRYRQYCSQCQKPTMTCYCTAIRPFQSVTQFVILMHKAEVKRSIATGRMAHLCVSNSQLFAGVDFSEDARVNALIANPQNYPVVLSPGAGAIDVSKLSRAERMLLFPRDRQLVVFLIDGTWAQARQMKRLSKNLGRLPAVCFTPNTPSQFRVREQPHPHCLATIEAIHTFIQLISPAEETAGANLLDVFAYMVNQQVQYEILHGAMRPDGSRVAKRGAR